MLRLTKKMLFAIEAVIDIAYHTSGEPVQSREITRRQGIPRRYLEQTLQHLVRAGILSGVRGPRGGYRLARERRRITVGEIVRVVRSADSSDDPLADPSGSSLSHEVVRPLWKELQTELMQRLDGITVQDLCDRARGLSVPSEADKRVDFAI
ncbi:MAG: Rrf2 family transcriptional regulator [Acetobacterales bacterium]